METSPGSGIFAFDKSSSKAAGTSDVYDVCYLCKRGKEETEQKKLFRCAACDVALYCSAQCQRSNWKQHKPICRQIVERMTFSSRYLNLLSHPKFKHHLSVAILSDPKLLRERVQNLTHTCRSIQIDILIHPEVKDYPKAVHQAHELMRSSPGGVRPEKLTAVETGYFGFHHGVNVKTSPPSGPAVDLWKDAKEAQRQSEDPLRGNNPIVLIDWVWNNAAMMCPLELSPEAFLDAQNGYIRREMRLDDGYGPLLVDNSKGGGNLLGIMNNFIQKDVDDKLGLRMKMTTYDRWHLLKTISESLAEVT